MDQEIYNGGEAEIRGIYDFFKCNFGCLLSPKFVISKIAYFVTK